VFKLRCIPLLCGAALIHSGAFGQSVKTLTYLAQSPVTVALTVSIPVPGTFERDSRSGALLSPRRPAYLTTWALPTRSGDRVYLDWSARPQVVRLGNRELLTAYALARRLLGRDGQPTGDIRGWEVIAGVGWQLESDKWPALKSLGALEGMGFYLFNSRIFDVSAWDGSSTIAPGLYMGEQLDESVFEVTRVPITGHRLQANGFPVDPDDVSFDAAKLRDMKFNASATFEGPTEVRIRWGKIPQNGLLPKDLYDLLPEEMTLQGYLKGGLTGFTWRANAEETGVALRSGRVVISNLGAAMYPVPGEYLLVGGSITLSPARMFASYKEGYLYK